MIFVAVLIPCHVDLTVLKWHILVFSLCKRKAGIQIKWFFQDHTLIENIFIVVLFTIA